MIGEIKENVLSKSRRFSSFRIIVFGFAFVILLGALLLCLPISSASGQMTDFLTSLFTSASATCVTGLVVVDTGTYWSFFGQLIILILIQIGGLGVVTLSVAISIAAGRKIGLMQRSVMSDSVSSPQLGGIVQLTRFIIKSVVVIEGIGAVLMAPVFIHDFGPLKGIWCAVFHSISAFCNAGFDIIGNFSSMTSYASNPLINFTLIFLIVTGGLGFLTWGDILKHKWHVHRYRLQTKIILVTSAILIAVPAVIFYFHDFAQETGMKRFLLSLFQSVTTRTAGFNTADFGTMSESGLFMMVILMLIGGAPGSTAGGMKVTTFAIVVCNMLAVMGRRTNTNIGNRRVAEEVIKSASSIFVMYLTLLAAGTLIISISDGLKLMPSLFEVASAIGTVGLTTGITTGLSTLSRLLVIFLMYIGRVGGLTLVFAARAKLHTYQSKLPEERVMVG
ncbi:MAG: TrkH family potassium uptake protein [Bulleidia sp.]